MLISIQRLLTVFFLFLPVHRDEGKGMREGREPSEEFFFLIEIVSCTFNYLMAGNDYSGLS